MTKKKKKKKKFKRFNQISDQKEDRFLKSKSFNFLTKFQKSKSYEKNLPKVLENFEEEEKKPRKSLRKYFTFLDHSEKGSNFSLLKNIDCKSVRFEKNQILEENFEDEKKGESLDSDSRSFSSISRSSIWKKKIKCDEIDKIHKNEDYKEIKEVIEEENSVSVDEENFNVGVLKKTRDSLKGIFKRSLKSDLVCLNLVQNKDYKFEEPNLHVFDKIEEND